MNRIKEKPALLRLPPQGPDLQPEQSAKIAKVGDDSGPMLFLSPRFEDETQKWTTAAYPGGTIVRANHLVRPDFLISWPNFITAAIAADRPGNERAL
jgi:hypothetical protein